MTDKAIDAAADVLWQCLDLNGHTKDGVRRAASAAIEAYERAKRDEELVWLQDWQRKVAELETL